MKFFILVTLLSFQVSAQQISAEGNIRTVLNPPQAGEVFVPPGFDDLDEAEITFVNHSRNSCFIKTYSLPPQVDEATKTIRISNMSLILKSDFCKSRNIATPTTLKVGELKAGSYKVEFQTAKGEYQSYGDIHISKSKSEEKDDFEYAGLDVNELTVKVNRETKKIELNLPGSFPNGCYAFKEIKVIDDRSPTVIEVLPIVETVTDVCTQDIQFYNKQVLIPYDVSTTTKKLIHIRSADGVAINRVVNLE
ncbi:MAG: hypothetical protein V4596_10225 [Bdellovibrionota bacterium]